MRSVRTRYEQPADPGPDRASRWRAPALAGVALIAGIVAVLLLLGGGDDDEDVEPGAPNSPTNDIRSTVPGSTLPSHGAALAPLPPPVFTLWVRAGEGTGGDGSEGRPFSTIEQALNVAGPGDTVNVGPGTYPQRLRSVRAGRSDRPIRLVGHEAEIRGDGDGRLVELNHDHIVLEGFRLRDGDILLWVQQATGVRVLGNTFTDAAGECVRLKYFSRGNEVANNRIERCGRSGFNLDADDKNGEGIYIGTAPEQRDDKNPTADVDDSGQNWVHDNSIEVPAECVDVKEGARENLVENNTCTGSQDPDGGGFSSRGMATTFRNNRSTGHAGAGIRLGGDADQDGTQSVVVGNVLADNKGYGVKVLREPQGQICGNILRNNGEGATKDDDDRDPAAPCR